MNNCEFCDLWWGNTEEDKKDAEAFIEKWNNEFVLEKMLSNFYPHRVQFYLTTSLMPDFN